MQQHKNTLVFVNMRSQTEKVARQLNEEHQRRSKKQETIAYAHHGSISRERRYEIEEEFVFESRLGDVFHLGNNEWRIDQIKKDRLVVTPACSSKPRAPFWKGDILYRYLSTQLKIGSFRRYFTTENLKNENTFQADLLKIVDAGLVSNLKSFLQHHMAHTPAL